MIKQFIEGLFKKQVEKHKADRDDTIHGPERKPKFPGVLDKRLRSYPPNQPLHPGVPADLTDAQIDENFAHMLAERDKRLECFSGLLREFGVDVSPVFDPAVDVATALDPIENWMGDYLPLRKHLPPWWSIVNAPNELFMQSKRTDDHIAFSLVADYALVMGEAFLSRSEHFKWGVNRHRSFAASKANDGVPMSEYRRPTLIGRAVSKTGQKITPSVFDLEMVALGKIYELRSRSGAVFPTSIWLKGWLDNN